jgi:SAM-dependent methyltransferase
MTIFVGWGWDPARKPHYSSPPEAVLALCACMGEKVTAVTLLEEYEKQNAWRAWARYLDRLPLGPGQTVYDLGCSVGAVTRLLARRVKTAVGFDSDALLLDEARRGMPANCVFLGADLQAADPERYDKCDGIWMSFTLAYIKGPGLFISNWMKCLNNGGWLALADIDGLFSSHLPKGSNYYDELEAFENTSGSGGAYDFRIGRKLGDLMEQNGLDVIVREDDWRDRELNFTGPAPQEIVRSWEARLARMVSLKSYFGGRYADFCREFLEALKSEKHEARGAVRYCVGVKRKK